MRNMGISHEEVIVPDNGLSAFPGPGIDRHIFTENIVPADLQKGIFLAVKFLILGNTSDHRTGKELAPPTDDCTSLDDTMAGA